MNPTSEIYPSPEEFSRLASQGNIIPVYREVLAGRAAPKQGQVLSLWNE